MQNFRAFLEASDSGADFQKSLSRLPKSYRKLVDGWEFKSDPESDLSKYPGKIGLLDPQKRCITIANPWSYPGEFAFLHEIGHLVWEKFVDKSLRREWKGIVKSTKQKVRQNAEELFCSAFANYYCKQRMEIHSHAAWDAFISRLPR